MKKRRRSFGKLKIPTRFPWLTRIGNVLTIEFDSGEQIVINIQTPTEQVWLASRVTGGFHFSWDSEAWKDSDGEDFWSVLGRAASQLSGKTVTFE